MSKETGIEWCHHTKNPVRGCTKISAGCANCYAESLAKINPGVLGSWGPHGQRVISDLEDWSREVYRWNKAAEKAGEVRRVFINSMWDPGEGAHGPDGEGRDGPRPEYRKVLEDIFQVACECKNLVFILLTKRPWNLLIWWRSVEADAKAHGAEAWWPGNVWPGVSVENQDAANARISYLLRIPARVRVLSIEPLVAEVDLVAAQGDPPNCGFALTDGFGQVDGEGPAKIGWVIVGGESGSKARPMHPDWARKLRDQCVAAGVPFFFKQWGEWAPDDNRLDEYDRDPWPCRWLTEDGYCLQTPFRHGSVAMRRFGKAAAGRMLDGRTWDEVPR